MKANWGFAFLLVILVSCKSPALYSHRQKVQMCEAYQQEFKLVCMDQTQWNWLNVFCS
jgi:hypothetical protein